MKPLFADEAEKACVCEDAELTVAENATETGGEVAAQNADNRVEIAVDKLLDSVECEQAGSDSPSRKE